MPSLSPPVDWDGFSWDKFSDVLRQKIAEYDRREAQQRQAERQQCLQRLTASGEEFSKAFETCLKAAAMTTDTATERTQMFEASGFEDIDLYNRWHLKSTPHPSDFPAVPAAERAVEDAHRWWTSAVLECVAADKALLGHPEVVLRIEMAKRADDRGFLLDLAQATRRRAGKRHRGKKVLTAITAESFRAMGVPPARIPEGLNYLIGGRTPDVEAVRKLLGRHGFPS